MERIVRTKKVHTDSVLFEQGRQRFMDDHSADDLAHLSAVSSRWSRMRSCAHNFIFGQPKSAKDTLNYHLSIL
jgi:hypothetical protein